jgi:hypothetical protein
MHSISQRLRRAIQRQHLRHDANRTLRTTDSRAVRGVHAGPTGPHRHLQRRLPRRHHRGAARAKSAVEGRVELYGTLVFSFFGAVVLFVSMARGHGFRSFLNVREGPHGFRVLSCSYRDTSSLMKQASVHIPFPSHTIPLNADISQICKENGACASSPRWR